MFVRIGGIRVFLKFAIRIAQIVVGLGIVVLNRDGLLIRRDCFVVLFGVVSSDAAIEIDSAERGLCLRALRVKGDRFLQRLERLLCAIQFDVGVTQRNQAFRPFRSQRQRLLVSFQRFGKFS